MSNFETAFENTTAPTGASYPKIDAEGTYTVKVLEASWVKTLAGNASQGKVQVEVVDGEKAGARVNLYVGAGKTDEQGLRNAKPFWDTLKNLGISGAKLSEDCDTLVEVIQNLMNIMAKRITKGAEIKMTLNVRINKAKSTELKTEFYLNPAVYVPASVDPIDNAPTIPASEDPFANL